MTDRGQPRTVVLMTNGHGRGGTEEHVLDVGTQLAARGHPVAAIVADRDDIRWLGEALSAAGVEVRVVPERSGRLGAVRRALALHRALRPYRHGILHLHFTIYPLGELTMLTAKAAGFKKIVRTEHNPPMFEPSRRQRVSLRVRDHFLDAIIVISPQDRQAYIDVCGRDGAKMTVVAHGVHLDRVVDRSQRATVRAELDIAPEHVAIGNVAHLQWSKGTAEFIRMAGDVAARHPNARFVMVGGGAQLDEYKALASECGCAEVISFVGQVPPHDVHRYLSAMDLFVCSSLIESGPYTVLEAMASSLPVVGTAVGFIPEVVIDSVGWVVPAGDVAALSAAVDVAMAAPDLVERGRAASQRVAQSYSIDSMIDRIIAVYEKVDRA